MDDYPYDYTDDVDGAFYDYQDEAGVEWEDEDYFDSSHLSLSDIVAHCVRPTLTDGAIHFGKLLSWCLIFRLSTQIASLPSWFIHLLSVTTGLVAMYDFFGIDFAYLLALCGLSYVALFASSAFHKQRGPLVSITCLIFLLLCELWIVDAVTWHKIRGSQMLLAMRVISIGFDLDSGVIKVLPDAMSYMGYSFCVGSVIFGPWVSYQEYSKLESAPSLRLGTLLKLAKSAFMALAFLSIATCWVHWVIPAGVWRWWLAYRDALSYRSSHYFVSLMAESTGLLSGLISDVTIVQPQHIEIPRSLVEVVIYWNMPMHNWLKTYVFRLSRARFGPAAAVACTYAASALLHGLSFPLAAVLLSLGAYTYTEFKLRAKVADAFSACVLARPCSPNCLHINKAGSVWVVFTNIVFGLLTMFHLTYLGVMFDSSSTEQEGYSMVHALAKWSYLSFSSHWLAAFTYLAYVVL